MSINIKGYIFRYKKEYFKYPDEYGNNKYIISNLSYLLVDGKWVECILDMFKIQDEWFVYVSASSWKDNQSELGEVQNSHGLVKKLKLSYFNLIRLRLYDFFFRLYIKTLNIKDKVFFIKHNIRLILIAILLSMIYYIINYYFDGYLQNLINESNLVQSLIVFLSMSSLINIVHPFSFRKEVSTSDVIKLNEIGIKRALEEEKRKEERKKYY